jgi:hypothetical protein
MSTQQRVLVVANKTADSPDLIASARIRQAGLELEETIVGDPDPFAAVGDALHARRFDEAIVSVLPHGISKWLALGLPARLRRTHDLPIHQVTAHSQISHLHLLRRSRRSAVQVR